VDRQQLKRRLHTDHLDPCDIEASSAIKKNKIKSSA